VVCRIVVALIVSAPLTSAAQDVVTVDSAVKAALAQNATLRAARAGVDEASARASQVQSDFFPRISITESWQRGNQPVFVFSSLLSARQFAAANFAIDALNHPEAIGFFRTSVGVEQVLFDGGRRRSAADTANLRRTVAEVSTDEAAASIALATTQTFGRILIGDSGHRAAEAALVAAREDLSRAERRRDAGMATDADVLALVVHVADLEQRAIQADGDAAIARAELNRLMGRSIDAPLTAAEPASASLDGSDQPNIAALLAEAEDARPEIKRAAANERTAEAAKRQARAAIIPQVAAQAAFDISGTRFTDRASSWIVGGDLRWTFSTGGAELASARAAAAAIARTRADADDVRAAIHVDVVSALRRVETARARQKAGAAAVDQARESQRIIRDRFEAGIAPVNDVLRASTAVLDADGSRVAAVVDTMVAASLLRRALGRAP
jgi:outer membrane protein TolC